MPGLLILLLLLGPSQDPQLPGRSVGAMKKAVVEVAPPQPPKLGAIQNPPADAPLTTFEQARQRVQAQQRVIEARERVLELQLQSARRLTLELKAVDEPATVDLDAPPPPVQRVGPLNVVEMAVSSENFDRWIFDDTRSDEGRRGYMGFLLSDKIRDVEKELSMDPDQARKLRLAGTGDIKRFLERVEAARVEFEAVRQDYAAGRTVLAQLEPLATEYTTGPFGPDSLFEKTLRKIKQDKAATRGEKK